MTSGDSVFKIMEGTLILGFVGIAIMLFIGIMIFNSTMDLVGVDTDDLIGDPEWEFPLILIAIPIMLMFILPLVIILGYDIVKPIKKILINFGLMVGLVKMRKIDD